MKHLHWITLACLFACKGGAEHHPYRKDVVDAVYASGYLIPESEYQVFAQTDGVVLQRMVNEGDTVVAGQLLYRVESVVAEARQAAATAAYHHAELDAGPQSAVLNELVQNVKTAATQLYNDSVSYRRYEHLWQEKAIAQADYDKARLQYEAARNDLKAKQQRWLQQKQQTLLNIKDVESRRIEAAHQVKQAHIRSAINGRVFELLKHSGETVKPNEWIATLGKAGQVYAQLWVDENDFSRVRNGQELWISIDAFPGKQYRAQVSRIYPAVQRDRQAFRVDAAILDTLPSQVVYGALEANIIVKKRNKALVIPKAWLAGQDSAYIKVNGEKTKVLLKKGVETLDEVEVLSGIDENTVILTGQ